MTNNYEESPLNALNLESLQQQYNNSLVRYQQAYQTLLYTLQNQDSGNSNSENLETSLTNVEILNNELVNLNNQIIAFLKRQAGDNMNVPEVMERQSVDKQLQSNLLQLYEEQNLVNNSIQHYQGLNNKITATGISTKQNYLNYLLYFALLIFIMVIFFKMVVFSKSTGQSGGGSNLTKMSDILFLLSLMVVFLSFGYIFKENAGFIIIFLVVMLYIFIKCKWIPNFLRI
jgi:hypothetical protein